MVTYKVKVLNAGKCGVVYVRQLRWKMACTNEVSGEWKNCPKTKILMSTDACEEFKWNVEKKKLNI